MIAIFRVFLLLGSSRLDSDLYNVSLYFYCDNEKIGGRSPFSGNYMTERNFQLQLKPIPYSMTQANKTNS